MNTLEQYGWNDFFSNHYNENKNNDFKPARVISLKGHKYHLITENGEKPAELSGKLLYGTDPENIPRVGDWVCFLDYATEGYITELLGRRNILARRQPGNRTERQVMAANIDYALIIQGLDRDFNIMRLDRYIVQITDCGIEPVVILNKEDLIESRDRYISEVSRLGRKCPVYFCSMMSKSGLDELYTQALKAGKTHILIGSSGVGKSSVINALLDKIGLKTSDLSDSTGKGKHTTTTSDLFILSNGSLIIDTPGMREFGIALDNKVTSPGLFPVIEEFAAGCRFSDCTHLNEAGCAVIEAFENGTLDAKIYTSYQKLIREQRRFEIKKEDQKRLGKQFGKMTREAKEFRKKYKY
ncbi:MAG TPA: ribosome small subunit-dependent GTPase A [Bacteroidales bacterium]|jgi:ribosome biogenesis GTPase|nr:ribosome small subunit-dependent GTPase A [Bacteroidales bacterium]